MHLKACILIDAKLCALTGCCQSNKFSRLHVNTDVLEILDLSYNKLSGMIPFEIGNFNGDSSVRLTNNSL